jgi:hypothetical protein
MATVKEGTVTETSDIGLPLPYGDKVCSYLIQIEVVSGSSSIALKGAAQGSNHTLLALAYKDMVTGENATAAITGDALVLVDSSGIGVTISATVSSGSFKYTGRRGTSGDHNGG